jgi:tRNA(Ile)-lysidine synthetase-like protein
VPLFQNDGAKVKYLVAVSGGVDSVVLLDMLASEKKHHLVVAHFDHGIRDDSAADARFVRELAKQYHVPFVTVREELGAGASEETARARRYAFLNAQAREFGATIVTAHHQDDVLETIAINLHRGTGWRGLSVFDNEKVARPLLFLTKEKIREYAKVHRLEWVEDSTNSETMYLRNRLRRKITALITAAQRKELIHVWEKQKILKREIDKNVNRYIRDDEEYSRYFFTQIDDEVSCEILRQVIIEKTGTGPTRPQLARAVLAIKVIQPGKTFELGAGVELRFTESIFIVKTP